MFFNTYTLTIDNLRKKKVSFLYPNIQEVIKVPLSYGGLQIVNILLFFSLNFNNQKHLVLKVFYIGNPIAFIIFSTNHCKLKILLIRHYLVYKILLFLSSFIEKLNLLVSSLENRQKKSKSFNVVNTFYKTLKD